MDHILALARDQLTLGWDKDASGYVASAFVLATFCMGSMRWLRITAIASNFAFIYYAAVADLLPVLALHAILLPVNVTRLLQIQIARASGKRLLARSTDPAPEEDVATPIFLNRQALADPLTALSLAEREQQRVACMLTSHLPSSDGTALAAGTDKTGRAAETLLDKIDLFLTGLATGGGLTSSQMTHLTGLRSRDEVLRALHETLGELAVQLRDRGSDLPDWLAAAMSEGLNTILLIAEDAARSFEDVDLLLRMTSDRSALVERLRSKAATSWSDGDTSDHGAVYVVTALYERTVWLLRRYAHLLETVAAMKADQPASIAEAETV
jgi:phosphate:Na+ symporter